MAESNPFDAIKLLNLRQVAEAVGRAPDTVNDWWHRGIFPAPIQARPGAPKQWRYRDVLAWIEKRRRARYVPPTKRGRLKRGTAGASDMGDIPRRRLPEYFETRSKKGRGMAERSLDLINVMKVKAEAAQPITGRGIGYKLFTAGKIDSMARNEMQRVYRLLKEAREQGIIPWEWIVDETRELEQRASWSNPAEYLRDCSRDYRRDCWLFQPVRVEIWSEKGTVRGVLAPVLDKYGVGFRVMHGFSGATTIHDVAEDVDGRPLIVLYVGDYDPSGLYMSEHDLPERLARYGGDHVKLKRVALNREHTNKLPSFPAKDKKKDPRYKWFVHHFGTKCWELDAMDPNDLRRLVEKAIKQHLNLAMWEHSVRQEAAEQESMRTFFEKGWPKAMKG